MQLRGIVVSCALAAVSSGCAYGEVRQVIRAQFATELSCPEVKLVRRSTWFAEDDPNQYKVTGCGTVRTYTCEKTDGLVSYDEPACTWVDGDADAPVHKPHTDSEPMDESMDAPMDAPMDEPPMDEPSMDGESSFDSEADFEPEPEAPKAKPKAKAKAKASGRLRLGD